MRSPLHLLCCATTIALLAGCPSPGPATRQADLDSLPPRAPEVAPVPRVGANPIVSVPRADVTGSAPAAAEPAPIAPAQPPPPPPAVLPSDTPVQPAPPRDTAPWVPIDTLR